VDWIHLAQDRNQWRALVNTAMNLWVLWRAEIFLTSWATVSFSGKTLLHGVGYSTAFLHSLYPELDNSVI
jgi:hypothetical protein